MTIKPQILLPSGSSAVVEYPPHHLKVQGLNPASAADTGKEERRKTLHIHFYFLEEKVSSKWIATIPSRTPQVCQSWEQ
jgi:hypothetical protein